ncbi:MAG: PspC domain-containing protein [Candidatus Aenigmatarchaeota archaeon]
MPKKKRAEESPSRKKPAKEDYSLEKRFEDFGEEVGKIGERFGRHIGKRTPEKAPRYGGALGIVNPFISSVISIILLAALAWLMGEMQAITGDSLILGIRVFISDNLGLFFVMFLFFSYMSYFSRVYPRSYRALSPLAPAVSIAFALWLTVQVIELVAAGGHNQVLARIIEPLDAGIWIAFWLILLLGYLVPVFGKNPGYDERAAAPAYSKKPAERERKSGVPRLYRSRSDKVLGGVCGGIGDYLGVDPVLIRLLWIISFFIWSPSVLAYLVAWIIIPRDPRDRW